MFRRSASLAILHRESFRRDSVRLPSAPWAYESQRFVVTRITTWDFPCLGTFKTDSWLLTSRRRKRWKTNGEKNGGFLVPIFSRFGADFFTVYADFSRFVRDINGEKKTSTSRYRWAFSRLVFHGLPPLETGRSREKKRAFVSQGLCFWRFAGRSHLTIRARIRIAAESHDTMPLRSEEVRRQLLPYPKNLLRLILGDSLQRLK